LPLRSTLFPYTTLFRSSCRDRPWVARQMTTPRLYHPCALVPGRNFAPETAKNSHSSLAAGNSRLLSCLTTYHWRTTGSPVTGRRSEEHTSELQSRENLV